MKNLNRFLLFLLLLSLYNPASASCRITTGSFYDYSPGSVTFYATVGVAVPFTLASLVNSASQPDNNPPVVQNAIPKFQCDNVPFYVKFAGGITPNYTIYDSVHTFNSMQDYDANFFNNAQNTIKTNTTTPSIGSQGFTIYVDDTPGYITNGVALMQFRPNQLVFGPPTTCTMSVSTNQITLPPAAKGSTLSSDFYADFICNHQPASYIGYSINPVSPPTPSGQGVIYSNNNITISLRDQNGVGIPYPQNNVFTLDASYSKRINFKVIADIGSSAPSGPYSTGFTITNNYQ